MELWTVKELRRFARRLGIAQRGRKAELIARIIRAEMDQRQLAA